MRKEEKIKFRQILLCLIAKILGVTNSISPTTSNAMGFWWMGWKRWWYWKVLKKKVSIKWSW